VSLEGLLIGSPARFPLGFSLSDDLIADDAPSCERRSAFWTMEPPRSFSLTPFLRTSFVVFLLSALQTLSATPPELPCCAFFSPISFGHFKPACPAAELRRHLHCTPVCCGVFFPSPFRMPGARVRRLPGIFLPFTEDSGEAPCDALC